MTITYDGSRRFGLHSIRYNPTSTLSAGTYHLVYPISYTSTNGAGLKLDLTGFHELQGYVRTTFDLDNDIDWIRVYLFTASTKFYYKTLDMPTKYWHKEQHLLADFTASGTPDITNINAISISFKVTTGQSVGTSEYLWIDGLRLIRHQILGEASDTQSQQTYGYRPLYLVDKGFQYLGYPYELCEAILAELKDEQTYVQQKGPLNVQMQPGFLLRTWDGVGFDNLRLKEVLFDFDKGEMTLDLGRKSADMKDILRSFGYNIDQIAQYGGDVTGVTPAEEPVIGCGTTCEQTCQQACMTECQTECELACQTGCEVTCQTGCEVTCESDCEQACQYCWESGPIDL